MKRILVVDDDATILVLEERVLTREGYQVIKASDGTAAMALLREQKIDLILLDIMMPNIDGFEVSRLVRSEMHDRRIPVVFITSRDDAQALKEGFRSGGSMFLTKPFTANQLVRIVNSMIKEDVAEDSNPGNKK